MRQNDWIGLGVSLAVHALLILLLAAVTHAPPEPEPIGYIAVDFGDFAEGRPVRRASETRPQVEAPEPEPEPEREPVEEQPAPPEVARPVDLPDEAVEESEEAVTAPETETIAPETQDNEEAPVDPQPREEPRPLRPLGGGAADGDEGEQTGQQGEGRTPERSSPYNFEGLNRTLVYCPPPPLPAGVSEREATVTVQISVDPQGRIGRVRFIRKGIPALERAVEQTLRNQCRFNPLPRNAPQADQVGTVRVRLIRE